MGRFLASALVDFLQPIDVQQVGQRRERHLRRSFRQSCYPLLFREHACRITMHSPCFPARFHDPTPRFPPLAPVGDRSPASQVLSRRYDILPPVPPHFVAFVWRYLRVHSFFSLPDGRVRRRGLELVTRYLRPGCRKGNDRISQVPGEPRLSVCTCSVDAGRTADTRPLRCSSVALGM